MNISRVVLLLLVSLCFFSGPAYSETEIPKEYEVKAGDTLWDISERFFDDPYYWPNLWAQNPFLRNPHLIYPQQQLNVTANRLQLRPRSAEAANQQSLPVEKRPEGSAHELHLRTISSVHMILGLNKQQSWGRIVDTTNDRKLLGQGDRVFVEAAAGKQLEPGQKLQIVHPGDWVSHPQTGKKIARQGSRRGILHIRQRHNDIYSGLITASNAEISRGDWLLPLPKAQSSLTLKKAPQQQQGIVIATDSDRMHAGQLDTIYIDQGAAQGLQRGHMLLLSRPLQRTQPGAKHHEHQLPTELLGQAVVLETSKNTASALVLKALKALRVGDRITTITPRTALMPVEPL